MNGINEDGEGGGGTKGRFWELVERFDSARVVPPHSITMVALACAVVPFLLCRLPGTVGIKPFDAFYLAGGLLAGFLGLLTMLRELDLLPLDSLRPSSAKRLNIGLGGVAILLGAVQLVLSGFAVAVLADGDATARESLRQAGFEDVERFGMGRAPDDYDMLHEYDDFHFEALRRGEHCKGGLRLEPGVFSLNARIHQECWREEPAPPARR